jgi:hypothetical protein
MKCAVCILVFCFVMGMCSAITVAKASDADGVASSTKVSAPAKAWEIRCADGSNNRWIISMTASAPHGVMEYQPIKASESSSGLYSGGEPRRSELEPGVALEIRHMSDRLAADTSLHATTRLMGTGLITITEAGSKNTFILASGPALDEWLTLLGGSWPKSGSEDTDIMK